ncbi:MAG TPA: carboxypeptidase-like regulatory domain-containing protein [Acidobacteriaceae bacterium]|nr:carboxypeptidase-like regulatory domain-containing protein [Acidobacteriaceae bacterium]
MRPHANSIAASWLFFLALALLCIGLPTAARAQVDAGAVRGTVSDASKAVIPGAKVTLVNVGTGLTTSVVTAKDGAYTFSPVKVGSYKVTAEFSGFRTDVLHVTVNVQDQVRADFTLVPGEVTQQVQVTSVAPQLQTQDASVGATATHEQIENLPLNGRNYTFLAQLNAGVTSLNPTRGLDQTGSFVANGLTSVHNNYILDGIDNNNDTVDFLNGAAYVNLPPPDAIQEFKLQTSNFSAEFGRAGGAVVNASVKSGTNQFHGSLWEFLRNNDLDAHPLSEYFNSASNRPVVPYKWNQFGGSAGLPILKNKLFIFGDYEGMRIRQGDQTSATVPTPAEVTSKYTNFSDLFQSTSATATDALGRIMNVETILDPATTRQVTQGQVDPVSGLVAAQTGYVRDPFYTGGSIAGITNFTTLSSQLNQMPANRLDPNAIKLLQLYPAANQTTGANEFTSNYAVNQPEPDNRQHFDVRVDYNLGSRDQMFVRESYGRRIANIPSSINGLGANPGFGSGVFQDLSNNLAASETHEFSATLINEARFGYSHLYTSAEPPVASQSGIPTQFGIQGIPQGPGNGGLPNINVGGLTSLGPGGYASPNDRTSNTIQFTENLTKIWSGHSLKVGMEYQRLSFPWVCPPYSRGYFAFSGYSGIPNVTNGVGAADLMLTPIPSTVTNSSTGVKGVDYVGGPNNTQVSTIDAPNDLRSYYGAYVQDDWKATRKLTVNLGLRWEAFLAISEASGSQAGLIPSADQTTATYNILSQQKSVQLSNSFLSLLAKDNIPLKYVGGSSILAGQKANFAPRIGMAYQFTPKLVARASYGVFYGGFENIGGSPDPAENYPFYVYLSISRPDASHPMIYGDGNRATLEDGLNDAEPDPNNPAFNAEYLGPIAYQQNPKTPYTQEWNASVQYQLRANEAVTVAYVGNNSQHMLNGAYTNQPTEILPPGTNPQNYIQFPDLSRSLNYMVNNGSSYYHNFEVTYERRYSNGVQFLANYTRSVCKTDNRNILNIGEGAAARAYELPGWGPEKDYTYCGDDVPNIFHASGIYALPFGKGQHFASNASTPVDAVIGGWSVQGIYTLQDGFPFSIGCPVSTTADYGCYANLVAGQNIYSHTSNSLGTQFLNPAAFANPPVATSIGQSDTSPLGGTGMQAHGPDYDDIDLSLFKQFQTTERTHLEFRAEAFNALNHPNFAAGFRSLDFRNTQYFGVIDAIRGNSRELQLALKFHW